MNRENDGKNTVKSGVYHLIANIISMVVGLVTLSLLSKIMTPNDMGISTSFIILQTVISYICLFAIYTSINKMLLDKNLKVEEFFSTISIFAIISTVIFYIIYLLLQNPVNNIFGYNLKLMTFMFITILFDNIFLFLYTKWLFYNKYIKSFIYNILVSPVSQIISLLFVYQLTTDKYYGRIIGIKIIPIIIGAILLINILIKGKFKFNAKYLKTSLIISIPIVAHLLSQIILSNSDLLMIKSMEGNSEAGIYGVAYTIGNVLLSTILCLIRPWSPWVYRRMENKEIDTIYNNSKVIIIFNFILCLGLMTIAPDLIKVFISESYFDAINIINPICVGMYFQGIYLLFYDIEYYHKATKRIAIFSIIAAVINIILNAIFIKIYGYKAAAYTTLTSYLILSVLHFIGMRTIDNRKVISVKTVLIYSLLLIILMFLEFIITDITLLRYLLFIISSLLIIIIEKDKMFNIFEIVGINKKTILVFFYNFYRFAMIKYDNFIKIFIKTKKINNNKKKVIIVTDLGIGDAMDFICIADKYNSIFPKDKYEITLLTSKTSYELLLNETSFDRYIKLDMVSTLCKSINLISRINIIKQLNKTHYDILIDQKWPFTEVTSGIYVSNIIDADIKYVSVLLPALQIPIKYINRIYTNIYIEKKINVSNIEMYNYIAAKVAEDQKVKINTDIHYKKNKDYKINIKLPNKYYIVFPSSSSNKKNWDIDKYISLIKLIYNKIKIPVVFCGTNSDKEIVDIIKNGLEDKMYIDILGKTNTLEFIEAIKKARFVITNDTGAYHIAIINEVPTAIISGVYTYDGFVTYGFKQNKYKKPYIIANKMKCMNCFYRCKYDYTKRFKCLEMISLDKAWKIVEKMIDENY